MNRCVIPIAICLSACDNNGFIDIIDGPYVYQVGCVENIRSEAELNWADLEFNVRLAEDILISDQVMTSDEFCTLFGTMPFHIYSGPMWPPGWVGGMYNPLSGMHMSAEQIDFVLLHEMLHAYDHARGLGLPSALHLGWARYDEIDHRFARQSKRYRPPGGRTASPPPVTYVPLAPDRPENAGPAITASVAQPCGRTSGL
jgi:hypothetical protein